MSLTIVYIYKNKDVNRVRRSLESLNEQTVKNFKVIFVDFGSDDYYSIEVTSIINCYSFVEYIRSYHLNQPWSRSKAINIALKYLTTAYVFITDIDIIFKSDFVEVASSMCDPQFATYFKVGYLTENESNLTKDFEEYTVNSESVIGAMGMSLLPVKSLIAVSGFNEFYHFWGSEDQDIHFRLKLHGVTSRFYKEKMYLLHQWHPSYRKSSRNTLTKELQVHNISRFNQSHFEYIKAKRNKTVNLYNWGDLLTENDYKRLLHIDERVELCNRKDLIDHFLEVQLFDCDVERTIEFNIINTKGVKHNKIRLKNYLNLSTIEFYTLKKVNDLLLRKLTSTTLKLNYSYEVVNLNHLRLRIIKYKL